MGSVVRKLKDKRHKLIERSDIVARRATFLRALEQNESGPREPVVYLDETWIITH